MKNLPARKPLRLRGFDYGQPGVYFVTICAADRRCLFGAVADGVMIANEVGRIVEQAWREIPGQTPGVELDAFVVMPNHLHGLVEILELSSRSVSAVVRTFKTWSTRRIRAAGRSTNRDIWQRGYYDHIVRNDADLDRIRQYIADNPIKWDLDAENPDRPQRP